MPDPIGYKSYLIRVWRPSGPGKGWLSGLAELPHLDWPELGQTQGAAPTVAGQQAQAETFCAEVIHIQTGRRWMFSDAEEILNFLLENTP